MHKKCSNRFFKEINVILIALFFFINLEETGNICQKSFKLLCSFGLCLKQVTCKVKCVRYLLEKHLLGKMGWGSERYVKLTTFVFLFLFELKYFIVYAMTGVPIFPFAPPPPSLHPTPTGNSKPFPCLWVMHILSLTDPLNFFQPLPTLPGP